MDPLGCRGIRRDGSDAFTRATVGPGGDGYCLDGVLLDSGDSCVLVRRRPIHLGIAPVVSAVWKYAVASLVASFCVCRSPSERFRSSIVLAHPAGLLVRIMSTSFWFTAFYLGAVILLHGGFEPLRQVSALLPGNGPMEPT